MHKQTSVFCTVDEKIAPVIQYIIDNYPMVIPFASCQGCYDVVEAAKLNESIDCYISLIVRNISQFNDMCRFFGIYQVQYQIPEDEFGCVPTWRITIPNLDYLLDNIKQFGNK